jgi:hypothetical protein
LFPILKGFDQFFEDLEPRLRLDIGKKLGFGSQLKFYIKNLVFHENKVGKAIFMQDFGEQS